MSVSKFDQESNIRHLRRLHYWLTYNRYTIFLYGGGFFVPLIPVLLLLIVLAVVFAPYMLYVLYKNGKHRWLVSFAVVVGIPLLFAFRSSDDIIADTILHFLPLLMFYAYCFVLRLSVGDWLSGQSPVDELWTEEENKET